MTPERDAPDAACVLVFADDWLCVQRVVVLLTARRCAVESFSATPSAGSWEVRVVVRCRPPELRLLQARLERLPSVTSVKTAGDEP